jgi:hypothetical protein
MESRTESESSGHRYRLWLTPLDDGDTRSVEATSFATADELLQALFTRWDHHFQPLEPGGDGSPRPFGADEP